MKSTALAKPHLTPATELAHVQAARRDVEQRLDRLRGRLEADLPAMAKTITRNGTWAAVVLGFAAGLALAYRTRRGRR